MICINNYSQSSFLKHIKSILTSIAFALLALFPLSAIADQSLTIEQLEKDASGNYLTPDSQIVQSLPEYNKNMKAGDVFKYSGNGYYGLYGYDVSEKPNKIDERFKHHGNLHTIWGELLDASEYNYIQPYRHGYCQYDPSVWEPVRQNNDWSQLPPCIKQFFIASNEFLKLTRLPAQPYPRLKGDFVGIAIDPEIAKDKAMIGFLEDIRKIAPKQMKVHIEIADEYSDENNVYLVDIDLQKLRRKTLNYPRVYTDLSQTKEGKCTDSVLGTPCDFQYVVKRFSSLSDHVGLYPQNIERSDGITFVFRTEGDVGDNGLSNWVTDEISYIEFPVINFIQNKTMTYDIFLYNFVNYIPFTSQEYWEDHFYPKYFDRYSSMFLYALTLMGVEANKGNPKNRKIQNQKIFWNKGLWLYEQPATTFALTLTTEGKFLVPDFILEGLTYVKPLDDVAIDRLYYMIPPEKE